MPLSSPEAAAALILLYLLHDYRKEAQRARKRRLRRRRLRERTAIPHGSPLRDLRVSFPEDFRNHLRMSDVSFQHLLNIVTPVMVKADGGPHTAITPERRLVATLHYLATGHPLTYPAAVSPLSMDDIIAETCAAIVEALKNDYVKFPKTAEEWLALAQDFEYFWNFPNCGGAIGGKHIRVTPLPADSGSYNYNYKGFFSIVLMAIVNARYEFIMVDIGKNGGAADGGITEQTTFHQRLLAKQLNLPANSQTKEGLNFVFAADKAFALHENVLKPFPQRSLENERKIFNYRLSRARRVAENALGVMSSRFRVLHTAINLQMDKIDLVLFACCMLHNYLRRHNITAYMPSQMVDQEDVIAGTLTQGKWRTEVSELADLQPTIPRSATIAARETRQRYVRYFNGVGALEWQQRMIV